MRIVFAGTPRFAEVSLRRLLDSSHDVVAVLTQPDRPAGRGNKVLPGPVKCCALDAGVPIYQPERLQDNGLDVIQRHAPDFVVVVAYGMILPSSWLALAPYGALNVHASLLPRWRGAAPIHRAIMAGDEKTGVAIMQMDQGLDTGPLWAEASCAIKARETTASLHDRLAMLGAQLLRHTLDHWDERQQPRPQSTDGITYAHKIGKEEAVINWQDSAINLDRNIRALVPSPVARTTCRGIALKIWQAHVATEPGLPQGRPGEILRLGAREIVVQCGQGALAIERLQRPGANALAVHEFCQGFPLALGDFWGEEKE